MIESSGASDDRKRSFLIDTTKEVRYVRMLMKYGIYYMGMWLEDENEETITKVVWLSTGSWTPR